jgi:CRP-like cAMP-binding protein
LDVALRKLEQGGLLSQAERAAFRGAFSRTRELAAGEDLLTQGSCSTFCSVVVRGVLARSETVPDGSRQIVAFLLPGDVFDLQPLATPCMDHSVTALTATTVATASHDAAAAMARAHPRLWMLLMREAAVEVAILRQWVVNCGRRNAHARTAHLFCELYSRLAAVGLAKHHACELPLTQAVLSDATGLSVVHVNRVLQQLRAEGLIRLKAGHLVVLDWKGLCDAAGFDPAYLQGAAPATPESAALFRPQQLPTAV